MGTHLTSLDSCECPILARVLEVARDRPRAPAVISGTLISSYADLVDEIGSVGRALREHDLAVGTLVAIVSAGDARLPGAFLGVRAAGLVPVLIDDMADARRIRAVMEVAQPGAVLHSVPDGDSVVIEPLSRASSDHRCPDEAGYVAFTSGSTGRPKGLIGSAHGVLSFLDWERTVVPAPMRGSLLTSPGFDVVLRDLLLPLTSGGSVHPAGRSTRSDPRLVVPWLADEAIEVVHVVPSVGRRWGPRPGSLPSLRAVVFAGEPLFDTHVAEWRAAAPAARLLNLYGPSETTLAKVAGVVPEPMSPGLQPVGRPLPGVTVELAPIPDEATEGRIVLSTPDGSLGYLPGSADPGDDAALTRADGTTRFVTADRGVWDAAGRLVVLGRLDSRVKRHGVLVDLARIERAAETLVGVTSACCVQVPDETRIVLWVTGLGDLVSLHRPLATLLGAERPDEIRHVDQLPLLPSGKPDRERLRVCSRSPVDAPERRGRGGS